MSLLLMVFIMPKITMEMTNDKNKDIRSKGLRNGEVICLVKKDDAKILPSVLLIFRLY